MKYTLICLVIFMNVFHSTFAEKKRMAHRKDKRQAAKTLYFEGFTQEQMCSILDISQNTLRKWREEENWEATRSLWESTEAGVWELMSYQTEVLRRMKEEAIKENKFMPLDKGHIDSLQKLSTIVRSKANNWSTYIRIVRELLDYMQQQDSALAKNATPTFDRFLKVKQKDFS